VAQAFLDASKAQESATNKKLPEAHYNAGLAYQRCDKHADARKQFDAAVGVDNKFHRARAQLALYDFEKSKDVEGTIRTLDSIIREAKFRCRGARDRRLQMGATTRPPTKTARQMDR
jgi:tetratricopeptide (TPR) repeat protein